jgi:hypothetical protein
VNAFTLFDIDDAEILEKKKKKEFLKLDVSNFAENF